MLEFVKVKSPAEIRSILKKYDPLKETWIVSDLKSKQEIQRESLQRYGYYTDDAIMRISDFWQLWLRRIEPSLKIVSSDFIKSLVQSFVDQKSAQLSIVESEVSTLNKALQEFAPILLHPASEDILKEWLLQQSGEKKWQKWYARAKHCLHHIVFEHRVLDAKWSAAYLQSLDLNLISWPRKMYIDLGSEMSSVEMGLLSHISKTQDVTILSPDPEWKERFPYLLNTYKENYGYGTNQTGEDHLLTTLQPRQFQRMSTQLAEVKYATAQIRKWAEQGVELNKIAVVAADIEKYWPVLQYYLDVEGLSYQKDTVARFNSLGDIQNLLAAIKNYSQDVAWESLEKTFFSKDKTSDFRFEKFKSLFFQLYDADDLAREQKVKNLFYRKEDFTQLVDRDAFLAFLLRLWIEIPESKSKNELFEPVFKDFLSQSINAKFKFSYWVQFFKSRLSRKEYNIKKSFSSGIYILPLMSAQMVEAPYRIYLGLNDEFYNRRQTSLMSLADSLELKNKFDLAVDHSEESFLDFNLRWQAQSEAENFIFLSAALDFNSDPLNTALFFLENSPKSEVMVPGLTRADELQKNHSTAEQIKNERILADRQGEVVTAKSEVFKNLSVSDIEKYSECGFKLLASKGFQLRDLPQVAIDLDNRDKGTLAHSLFEFCIKLITNNEFSQKSVADFLDGERSRRQIYILQDNIWNVQKNKLLILANRFFEFEKDRVKIFEVYTEKNFTLYFDLDKKQFSVEQPVKGFKFNIRTDRIDKHKQKKYCIVYDYKSSSSRATHHSKWVSENQFQMLLYLTALQLMPIEGSPTVGALYYQYKNFNLKQGLIEQNIAETDLQMHSKIGSKIDETGLAELQENFLQEITEKLEKLWQFQFSADPFKTLICQKCEWSRLCRAPHLM